MKSSVRRARSADSRAIARVHREVIPWGLLSQLGEGVVAAFYRAVADCPAAFCFVAEENGELVGFAAGVTHWPALFRDVLRRTWWPLVGALPRLALSGRWRRLWETSRYTRSRYMGVSAEFFSFGVRPQARGRVWVGSALFYAGIAEFRRRGVPKIRGVVWERNERALRFFQAVGFRFADEVEIHSGERSRTFVMDIPAHPPRGAAVEAEIGSQTGGRS